MRHIRTSGDFEEVLLAARAELVAMDVMLCAIKLQMLVRKANFNPDQPRVPSGNPDGGQWTDDDSRPGDEAFPLIFVSHDSPPEIPEERPPTTQERNRIAVTVARYWRRTANGELVVLLARAGWLLDHAGHAIRAYLDKPKSLEELQRAVSEPTKGYNIHHIVEQTPARQDGFPNSMINASENLVRIPTFKHWEITAWYARQNEEFGGLAPREYLRGQSWPVRIRIGKRALIDHGVLKP